MPSRLPSTAGPAAVHLRLQGTSWADIADTLGLANAKAAVQVVTRELSSHSGAQDRDMLRAEESERLLSLLRPVMERATDPHDPEHLAAVKTAVAVIDRRIRLLGLDAPTQLAIHTPSTQELEAWVTQMATVGQPQLIEAQIIELEP